MDRLRFGSFLAPHHPLGESPTLLLRRDLDLVEQLDRLGYDELWCGEHHSSGWETIASPEMFLAAAGERTGTIRLGTGVVSLPYHHPFHVAQRIVQLDHMTRGRAMFGSGPGRAALGRADARHRPDAHPRPPGRGLGRDPPPARRRGPLHLRVATGSRSATPRCRSCRCRSTYPLRSPRRSARAGCSWPASTASACSRSPPTRPRGSRPCRPSGRFAEESAAVHGQQVDRRDWRVLMAWHIAEDKEQARREAVDGLHRWHNEYNVHILGRPGARAGREPVGAAGAGRRQRVGRGRCGGDRHAGRADRRHPPPLRADRRLRRRPRLRPRLGRTGRRRPRSWDLVARYVIPELNGQLRPLRASAEHLHEQQGRAHGRRVRGGHAEDPGQPSAPPTPWPSRCSSSRPGEPAERRACRRTGARRATAVDDVTRTSVVPQGHRVRRDVDLRLVLGRCDLDGRGRRSGRAAR